MLIWKQVYKTICCGYSFKLPRLVEAIIQMSTHNIFYYKEEIYTDCNLKPMKSLDWALIGVCAGWIRYVMSNGVFKEA